MKEKAVSPAFSVLLRIMPVALLLASSGAAAQLYRCAIDDGRIIYSDRKCAPAAQRETVKITDNAMDNSNLGNEAAIRAGLDSAMAAQGGGRTAVIRDDGASSSSSSPATGARRRCGG